MLGLSYKNPHRIDPKWQKLELIFIKYRFQILTQGLLISWNYVLINKISNVIIDTIRKSVISLKNNYAFHLKKTKSFKEGKGPFRRVFPKFKMH